MAEGGRLTTHVLDTMSGKPAAGLAIDLFAVNATGTHKICSVATNQDGRCDQPLLAGEEMQRGTYELHFAVGPYFTRLGAAPKAPFLDVVPVRLVISEPGTHYHVPLLVSPFGYSTYKGS